MTKKQAVIPNLIRNRKVKVDGQCPCDPVGNQTFFTKSKILEKADKQVQGDENRPSFRTCFGIAGLRPISSNLAAGIQLFKALSLEKVRDDEYISTKLQQKRKINR